MQGAECGGKGHRQEQEQELWQGQGKEDGQGVVSSCSHVYVLTLGDGRGGTAMFGGLGNLVAYSTRRKNQNCPVVNKETNRKIM